MSELQRHIDANEKEEIRHIQAGEEEMAEHVSNTRTLPELQAEVTLSTNKARRAGAVRDTIFGLCVLGALVLSIYTIISSNSASVDNGHRIDILTDELAEARDLLLAESIEDQAVLDCQADFDTLLRQTSFEPLASIGDLVIIISSTTPGPEREEAVVLNIQELGHRIDETRAAIARLAEWNNAGNVLPCPI